MKKSLFFLAAATIALASCSNEEVIEQSRHGEGIDFRAAITQGTTSRGVETTTATLKQFNVTALYGNTTWFENVLFTNTSADIFESAEDYFWPGHGSLEFFAWGYNSGMNGMAPKPFEDDKLGSVTVDKTAQTLTFTPQSDVAQQIDLVTAYKVASKADVREDGIGLDFGHALCEIQINAKSANTDYEYYVAGVAVCSVNNKGTLSLRPSAAALDDDPATVAESPWTFDANVKSTDDYVVIYPEGVGPIRLVPGDFVNISNIVDHNVGFIMPIPQTLTAWDHEYDQTNSHKNSYLAVLIRIYNPDSKQDVYPRPAGEDGYRVGSAANGTAKQDNGSYGWACVPVSTVWEPGKRYIYNLDFSYGAGQFPPGDPDQPGEDILGGPIKFNVTMTDWVNASDINVNMNGHDTDEQDDTTPVE